LRLERPMRLRDLRPGRLLQQRGARRSSRRQCLQWSSAVRVGRLRRRNLSGRSRAQWRQLFDPIDLCFQRLRLGDVRRHRGQRRHLLCLFPMCFRDLLSRRLLRRQRQCHSRSAEWVVLHRGGGVLFGRLRHRPLSGWLSRQRWGLCKRWRLRFRELSTKRLRRAADWKRLLQQCSVRLQLLRQWHVHPRHRERWGLFGGFGLRLGCLRE
jgi:hypothetical protein